MPEAPQWARVRADVNCHVRRGAWYEVLRLTPDEAILNVSPERIVSVNRGSLQIVPVRPRRWSIVPRPRDAVDIPLSWGSRYAVVEDPDGNAVGLMSPKEPDRKKRPTSP